MCVCVCVCVYECVNACEHVTQHDESTETIYPKENLGREVL